MVRAACRKLLLVDETTKHLPLPFGERAWFPSSIRYPFSNVKYELWQVSITIVLTNINIYTYIYIWKFTTWSSYCYCTILMSYLDVICIRKEGRKGNAARADMKEHDLQDVSQIFPRWRAISLSFPCEKDSRWNHRQRRCRGSRRRPPEIDARRRI